MYIGVLYRGAQTAGGDGASHGTCRKGAYYTQQFHRGRQATRHSFGDIVQRDTETNILRHTTECRRSEKIYRYK